MKTPNHVAILAFDGVQVLDVTGPAAVFAAANDAAGQPCYRIHILSAHGGLVTSNSGVALQTQALSSTAPAGIDTVLVAGGSADGLQALACDDKARDWTTQASARARRYGSVCSGALVLAAWGLVRGKRVATHWEATELLGRHADLQVDADALYVEDGRVWTSAGVTTGIDMCLALVARDLGDGVANAIARRLVLYARRPGYQSQFSPMLTAQARAESGFSSLLDWVREHLAEPLDVERLAERAGMSPRHFHRRFTEAFGATPARFVETLRLDAARQLLAAQVPLKEIAARTGYANPGQFSKAFVRRFGISPGLFRETQGASHTA
ncbi:helix-turn-helix domain-containing protein [Massilia forsythiae]|uniref:Helix-turn-helix domain-containing protein n=1 Tax=Massilia forsythiae TaxID=2728020 RepID=A0A7Z2VVL4_9BURK|nr:helix-turn-helix domain-containing protein [Massilia forsythiae]QJE00286.1 helix-turn-helix domain-containing protein [Massilia forsythiae]